MVFAGCRDGAFVAVADRSDGGSVTSADRSEGGSVGDPVAPTGGRGGGVGETIGAPDGSGVIPNRLKKSVGRAVPEEGCGYRVSRVGGRTGANSGGKENPDGKGLGWDEGGAYGDGMDGVFGCEG